MAGYTPPAPVAGSIPAGCGGPWPRCHCRGPPTADWSWPSTSPAGYAPTCTPHRSGSRVTPTAGEKTSTSLSPAGRTRSPARSSRSQFLDRPFGRASPGPRERHGHRHRPTAAGPAPPTDHRRAMAGGRPRRPRHRGRRIRRIPPCVPPSKTCRSKCSPGCTRTGCCSGLSHPASHTRWAAHPGTAANSSSASPTPGASRTQKPSPTHAFTAPPRPAPGTGCTPGSPTAPPGPPPTAPSRSSKARCSASTSITCPTEQHRSRSGRGGQAPTPPRQTPTVSGRLTCDASTSSTPSACSNRPWAGPPQISALPEAADRRTWLILAAYTQHRLARTLAAEPDRRRPWENPSSPDRLTPARVRPRLPAHPPTDRLPAQSTETHQPRPRTDHRAERTPIPHRATTCTHPRRHSQQNDKRMKSTSPKPRRTGSRSS